MQYFETRFLEEADKFISTLDLKTARKVFYNIDLAEQTTQDFSRNLNMTFGNLEHFIQDFKLGF
jgi:hypothetical protein